MTYKNAKTILFAGLIAAITLLFSGMSTVAAEEIPDKIYILAEQGGNLARQIEELQIVNFDGSFDSKIKLLESKLEIINDQVDDYGLFSPEAMQIEMAKPIEITPEITEQIIMCDCETAIVFNAGIFYQMFGYYQGMSDGESRVLVQVATGDISDEIAHSSINQDWGYLYTRAKIVDSTGTAEIYITPSIKRENGDFIRTYNPHHEVISSTDYVKIYELPQHTSTTTSDRYIIHAYLNWVT